MSARSRFFSRCCSRPSSAARWWGSSSRACVRRSRRADMARLLFMRWVDLAFLHWRVSTDALRPLIPAELEIDEFDGSAWVAVAPFRMTAVRAAALPPLPTMHDFPELNVRTYV